MGQADDARAMGAAGRPHPTRAVAARRLPRGGGIEERFKQFDQNGDGKLTPDEFPRVGAFRQMDTDNDGVLTLDEVRLLLVAARKPNKRNDGEDVPDSVHPLCIRRSRVFVA